MSCNCNQTTVTVPASPTLVSITDLNAACADTPTCSEACTVPESSVVGSPVCADPNALRSSGSAGTTLENKWTDAVPDHSNQGVTLLARIGQKLASLKGSGFLQLKDGKVRVVSAVTIAVKKLWHAWTQGSGINSRVALGAPLPYPYQVITDAEGTPHIIQGHAADDSVNVWNAALQQWEVRPVSEFPIQQKGLIDGADAIELTGFEPVPLGGDLTLGRSLKKLSGSGVIVVNEVTTAQPDCDCEVCVSQVATASVATFLPFPTGDATHTLKWSEALGPHWSEDA
jgi:hypothetical protein